MKFCSFCKAELDDNARFCLHCMTSLEEKEQIPPPVTTIRRWPFVVLCILVIGMALYLLLPDTNTAKNITEPSVTVPPVSDPLPTEPAVSANSLITHSENGVKYTFRPATREDHPTAIDLDNYYVLIGVTGTPSDGIFLVPSFVGNDTSALVTVVADGAFDNAQPKAIDLGYNIRYVWGNAFGGYGLTDLYLHQDVRIDHAAFSGCTETLTIHGPDYLENTEDILWSELANTYGFQWQSEIF